MATDPIALAFDPSPHRPTAHGYVPERHATAARLELVRVEALGPLGVRSDGTLIRLRPAERRVLASFVVTPASSLPLEVLIDRVWGESPPRTASRALHVHLSALRRKAPGLVLSASDGYRLDLDRNELDVLEFAALAEAAPRYLAEGRFHDAADASARAGRLWRGDPFPELIDSETARGERDRLIELHLGARATHARALTLQGRLGESIAELRQLIAEQVLNESLWEELVLAYHLAGRPADARAALAAVRTALRVELATDPGPRLRDLEERVMRQDGGLADQAVQAIAHNLPVLASSFVGRDADVDAVSGALAEHPLVTIVGPPGIGKTRLAIEVAARLLGEFPAGVWLVRLAESRTDRDVMATLTSVLAISEHAEDPTHLYRAIAPRPALLVVDNCEHVLDLVRRLLEARLHGDRVRVLATSRERLGADGEMVWPLKPLSLPDLAANLWGSAAVQLLIDRVAASDPTIDLANADPDALIEVCRRTDGLPLALELAARRIAFLDEERAADIDFGEALDAAGSGSGDGSVGRAIARSIALLSPVQQGVFDAAAVFAAPFTEDAFGAVCVRGRGATTIDHALSRLVETSLLVPERSVAGPVRYRMLEPLRDHGLRRLTSGRRARGARDRHAAYFASVAQKVAAAEWSSHEVSALDGVAASIADFRAAMRHLLDTRRAFDAAEIAAALTQFWIGRFLAWEGHRWLEECLAHELGAESRLRTLGAASGVAFFIGKYDESAALSEKALELARQREDRQAEARALYGIGRVDIHRRPARGRRLVRGAIAIFEETGDRVAAAECRIAIGIQEAHAGESVAAESILRPATATLESEGYPRMASVGHRYLSLSAWHRDDEPSARRELAAALALAHEAHDRRILSGALTQKGMVEARYGDASEAASAIADGLDLIAGQQGMYFALTAYGAIELLVRLEEWTLAAQVLAHMDAMHEEHGWIPLDARNAGARAYRTLVADGLTGIGVVPDLARVSTSVMSDRLLTRLRAVDRMRLEPCDRDAAARDPRSLRRSVG